MLHLHCDTPETWLRQVDGHLEEILIDHAHCEKKAAACAMNLLSSYIETPQVREAMTEIVNEELEHFHQVLALIEKRGIEFRRLKPGGYGTHLNALVRKFEPERALDRLLVAGLIEARSCERFHLLEQHVPDQELAEFYGSLFESEARHHSTYVRLAKLFDRENRVEERLNELAEAEAEFIRKGDPRPRMHS